LKNFSGDWGLGFLAPEYARNIVGRGNNTKRFTQQKCVQHFSGTPACANIRRSSGNEHNPSSLSALG